MWQVVGQNRAVSLFQRSLELGAVSHAYLFVGPPHVGKMTLAINLAQAMNCQAAGRPCGECASCQRISSANHSDVQVIGLILNENTSEGKLRAEIGIDQIREMQHSASLPPFEGQYKIFIIEGAELLSNEAANCLLKTLEEPTGKVIFVLLTTSDSLLPATVVSRCQRLELLPIAVGEAETALNERWNIESPRAKLLARFSHGCLGWALLAASDDGLLRQREEEIDRLTGIINADYNERFVCAARLATRFSQNRGQVQEVLDLWLDYWRDLLLVKLDCSDIITNIDRLDALVDMARNYSLAQIQVSINCIRIAGVQLKQNANPRLALEVLMLDMSGKESGSEEILADRLLVKYG